MANFLVFDTFTGGLVLETPDYHEAMKEVAKRGPVNMYVKEEKRGVAFMVVCRSWEPGVKVSGGLSFVYSVYFSRDEAEKVALELNQREYRSFEYSVDEVVIGRRGI